MRDLRQKTRSILFVLVFGALALFFAFRALKAERRLDEMTGAAESAASASLAEYVSTVRAELFSADPDPMLLYASALLGRDAVSRVPLDPAQRDSLRRFFGEVCRGDDTVRTELAGYADSLLDALLGGGEIPYFPDGDAFEAVLPVPADPLNAVGATREAREKAERLLGSHLSLSAVPVGSGYCFACENACVRIENGRVTAFVREYGRRAGEELSTEGASACAAHLLTLCGYRTQELLFLGGEDGILHFRAKTKEEETVRLGISAYSGVLCLLRVGD